MTLGEFSTIRFLSCWRLAQVQCLVDGLLNFPVHGKLLATRKDISPASTTDVLGKC